MARQKRSENTYQKINTIFKRDNKNVIMQYAGFVTPELEYLRSLKWRGEEKIDGTNIRIEVTPRIEYVIDTVNNIEYEETNEILGVHFDVTIKGKIDNSQIPSMLKKYMEDNYPKEKVLEAIGLKEFIPVNEWVDHKWNDVIDIPKYTIYGEGYGAKIQKAGENYIKNRVSFVGFDVKVNDIYLLTNNRDDIINKLGAPIAPFIGYFTLDEAIEYVRKGFKSRIAENKDFIAEGLVLRTELGLKNRRGERLIIKIKYKDFQKYRNVYGTDDPVEQIPNEHY